MKGNLEYHMKKLNPNEDPEKVMENCRSLKFKKGYFYFLNDLFVWKEKMNSSDLVGRIFMITISDIGIGIDGPYLYLVNI